MNDGGFIPKSEYLVMPHRCDPQLSPEMAGNLRQSSPLKRGTNSVTVRITDCDGDAVRRALSNVSHHLTRALGKPTK